MYHFQKIIIMAQQTQRRQIISMTFWWTIRITILLKILNQIMKLLIQLYLDGGKLSYESLRFERYNLFNSVFELLT